MLTLEEVDRRSWQRARDGRRRLTILAGLVVFVCFILAAGLQVQATMLAEQQAELEANLRDQCDQRKANVMLANKRWEDLIAIEQDPERVRIYERSLLTMPSC